MTASRRDAPHWSIPTTTIISEPRTPLIGFGSTAGSKRLALAPLAQANDDYRLYAPETLSGSPVLLTAIVDDARAVGTAMTAAGPR